VCEALQLAHCATEDIAALPVADGIESIRSIAMSKPVSSSCRSSAKPGVARKEFARSSSVAPAREFVRYYQERLSRETSVGIPARFVTETANHSRSGHEQIRGMQSALPGSMFATFLLRY
jgi:hypothetical protein